MEKNAIFHVIALVLNNERTITLFGTGKDAKV